MSGSKQDRPPISPILVLAIGILATASSSIFVRYAQNYASTLVIATFRLVLATLFLAPFAITRRREELSHLGKDKIRLSFTAGIFLALHFVTWFESLKYTTVASSVVLVSTAPIWVAVLSPLMVNESLRRNVLIGLGLAFGGSIIVAFSDVCRWDNFRLICSAWDESTRGSLLWGDFLALIGSFMAAAYVLIGRKIRPTLSLLSYVFVVYGIGGLALVVGMLFLGQSLFGYPSQLYLWVFLLALVPQLLGHSSFNWALGYLSAVYVSVTLLAEPIGSTILAYFLLDEKPTLFKIFGAILILAGIYIARDKTESGVIDPRRDDA